ncbi:MAG: hypothetical protein IJO83_02360 [Clostridia bacterium]|nr:hypothetical protein [Clostridia bacterium]
MDIKLELLRGYVADFVKNHICDFEVDADKIADSRAIAALKEIQEVIQDEDNTDFDAIEKIVLIFEKYQLSFSPRHDF